MRRRLKLLLAALAALLLASCAVSQAPPTAVPAATATLPPPILRTATASPSPSATHTPAPTDTPAATATPTVTFTPDPYAGLYIDDLRARTYAGTLRVVQTLAVTETFTRSLIAYDSDGLTIYGFMNMPRGPGPFPVVIVNHGYIDPGIYQTLTYMVRYTDPLAAAGFLVIHPDYRGYGQSDDGPNAFRIGFAVDVLNLVAAVRQLPEALPGAIGLFGHSMGGGISLRAITVDPGIRAALLYGSMSGDETANFLKIREWSGNQALPELQVPPEVVDRIEPINALDRIEAVVSLHHGDNDATVPPQWSTDLYGRLSALGKPVEYYVYPGQPHTFVGDGHTLLMERAVVFFRNALVGE